MAEPSRDTRVERISSDEGGLDRGYWEGMSKPGPHLPCAGAGRRPRRGGRSTRRRAARRPPGGQDGRSSPRRRTAIERALTAAAVPADLWSELVAAGRERRTFPAVRDLTVETRKHIGHYPSDLVVVSRVHG